MERGWKMARAVMVHVSTLMLVAMLMVACGGSDQTARVEMHKRLAGELQNNRLYVGALEEYEKVLSFDGIDNRVRANINYLMARIYYENFKDYQHAAAYYVRAREYDPEGSFGAEASKHLVASLEKLGNIAGARRQLDAVTNIDQQEAIPGDPVVAKLGSRSVRMSELEFRISQLPPEVQSELLGRDARLEFIRQYVGIELLYAAAVREDYLSDTALQRQQEELVKRLVVDKFIAEKVVPRDIPDTLDLHNYYRANKVDRYNDAPFDSVRGRVYVDYQTQKAEAAYREYVSNLVVSGAVEFLDYNVK